MSMYNVIARKTTTIGKSLKGGTSDSKSLSSILLPFLDTIFFTLFTRTFATTLLTNRDKIIHPKIIVSHPGLYRILHL